MPTEIIVEGTEPTAEAANQIVQQATQSTQIVTEAANNISNATAQVAAKTTSATTAIAQETPNIMWWNKWYLVLAFALIIITLILFVAFIIYLDHRKRMAQPKEKRNILLIILICGFATIVILLISEFVGVLPRGWNAENGKWLYPLIIGSMLGFGMYMLWKGKAKKLEKAYDRALQVAEEFYGAQELRGPEHGFTVKVARKGFEIDDKGNKSPVGNFFLYLKSEQKFMLIIQLSLTDLSLNYLHHNPDVEFVKKELSKKIGVVADAYIEAKERFDQESRTQPPRQELRTGQEAM